MIAATEPTLAKPPDCVDHRCHLIGRKSLFFKPVSGYGGKAVYRGDKLTHSVWNDLLAADHVAQVLAPGERQVMIDGQPRARKMDARLFTYGAEPLLAAARLYQG